MNKSGIFIIPLLIFAVISILGTRLFASGGMHPAVLVALAAGAMLLMVAIRPKNKNGKASPDAALTILGDFAKDAFDYDEKLSSKFQSAVADYINSMPKSAINKLTALEAQCKTDADTYAVSIAMGLAKTTVGDFEAAIKLYNKAVVIYPTSELADAIGSAQQRIGELRQAMDSYAFALELDPDNIDVRGKLATAYVADGDFEMAIEHAQLVLDRDEKHASALATIAICHGVLGHEDLYTGYTAKAVDAGYKEDKITSTVPALKKKFRKTLESMN